MATSLATAATSTAPARPRATRALLAAGIAATPVFVVTAAAQVLTREGYHLDTQPLSLLSLGDLGWIQITNFVLTGLLALAAAVGLRRAWRGSRGGTWGPRLIGGFGVGLVAAGVFRTDPSMGYPVGAPAGAPTHLSWHAMLHGVAAPVAYLSVLAAYLVFASRFRARSERGWANASVAVVVAVVVLLAWPDFDSFSVRLAASSVPAFGWLAVVAARQLRRSV